MVREAPNLCLNKFALIHVKSQGNPLLLLSKALVKTSDERERQRETLGFACFLANPLFFHDAAVEQKENPFSFAGGSLTSLHSFYSPLQRKQHPANPRKPGPCSSSSRSFGQIC